MSRNRIGQFAGSVWTRTKRAARFLGILFVISLLPTIAVEMYAVKKANAVAPERITIERTVEVYVEGGIPPVLERIKMAESGGYHYCTQEAADKKLCRQGEVGQVMVNDTKDVGIYQINLMYNGKWCAERGYNIFIEADNEACALALFNERGSEPWSASKSRWNK